MMSQFPSGSLALFGSAARRDHDGFSDWDLLVVMDDETALRSLKAHYDSNGWSCSAYSWRRLQQAANQGSLFVQHLKQEAKIIRDPFDRLAGLLDMYNPRSTYKREAEGAASLLGELTQQLPLCGAGPMWTLDVLSVGFRSLAVAKLADHGIYSFSNTDILNGLMRTGLIRQSEAYQLRPLRQFKSLYRRGLLDKRANWSTVHDMVGLIDRVFVLGFSTGWVATRDILELALADDKNVRWSSDWYVRCRRIESALLMLKPRHHKLSHDFIERRQGLLKIVKSPNSYASHFTRGHVETQRSLAELAAISRV